MGVLLRADVGEVLASVLPDKLIEALIGEARVDVNQRNRGALPADKLGECGRIAAAGETDNGRCRVEAGGDQPFGSLNFFGEA